MSSTDTKNIIPILMLKMSPDYIECMEWMAEFEPYTFSLHQRDQEQSDELPDEHNSVSAIDVKAKICQT